MMTLMMVGYFSNSVARAANSMCNDALYELSANGSALCCNTDVYLKASNLLLT